MSKPAQQAKERGNKAFKKGNHALAIKYFTEAIALEPKEKSFYSNRSAAYAAAAKHDNRLYDSAVADALKVIELDADWGKGYARHANALYLKGDYSGAVQVYAQGIAKDPSNASLTQGLQAAQKKIQKKKEKKLEDERKEEDYAIGIDLGTTYSCVAVWKDDGVQIIQNALGDRTTPSYVGWNSAGERFIGHPAKTMSSSNSKNTIFDIKRVIGQRFGDAGVEQDIRGYPFTVEKGDGDRPVAVVEVAGKRTEFAPEEISAMVLGNMKETAEAFLGFPVTKAVITVPAYFNDAQRNATKAAGKIAGLEVLRIINEPTAAALAYGLNNNMDAPINVLVFDLGGGTFDVSLLHITGGLFEVKATGGDTRLGGEDFDLSVVEHLLKEAAKQGIMGVAENGRAATRLRFAAEKAKRTLSAAQSVDIEVENLIDGKDFNYTLTRAKFEAINKAPFMRCLETVQRVLKDAKVKNTSVHEIVLVGGSTRIPKLQEMLREFFNGKELCKTVNPDEAVAYGAAVQAGILSGRKSKYTKDLLLMDITPLSLGIEIVGRVMSVIIPRNTHVPCVRKHTYTTESDYQTEVEICVYEGERMKTEFNNLLGKFMITGIERAKKGEPQIEVRFELDADGILKVTATDQVTGSTVNIVVENRQATTTDEVKRMIAEAELYKAHDREQVAKVEATEKLQNIIFKVLEVSKEKGVSIKLGETLENAANDAQDWLDDHADVASTAEIKKHLGNLERRIQSRQK